MEWLTENKQWVFSGIGVAIIGWVFLGIKGKSKKNKLILKQKSGKNSTNIQSAGEIKININSQGEK